MNLSQLIKSKNKLLILKNVDNTPLGVINARDIMLSPRGNEVSLLSFTVDRENCEVYDLLSSYRIIELQGIKFIIENPINSDDGKSQSKTITCRSYEIDINRKTIPYLNGTYKFHSLNTEEETITKIVLSYLPNWTIDSVDVNLWNIFRSFDISNRPLYQFIMEDVALAFEAVFYFDTSLNKITVKSYENVIQPSDIYLSFNNLVNKIDITEKTEELVTALSVFGGNVDINLVNPLGNTIYNFQHFTDTVDRTTGTKFMSDGLITAIHNWEDLISTNQTNYSTNLTNRKTKLSELIILQTDLVTLKGELKSLILVRDALLEANLSASEKNAEVIAKRAEIIDKEIAITSKQSEIDVIDSTLQSIQNTVSLQTFFTNEQLSELEHFIIHQSVTDENFVVNEDIDSELDKQNMAQALYDKYVALLNRNSVLKYEFSIELENFIPHEQYELFTSQLQFFTEITLDNGNNTLSYPVLLGLDIPLDDTEQVKFLFSTSMRLSNQNKEYNDYLNTVSSMANKVNNSSLEWGLFKNSGTKDKTDDFFQNGLNLDLQEIKSATGQEITFDSTGLQGRKKESENTYSLKQWKFINNKLLFTDDNWNSAKLGIGEINLGSGGTAYGVSGEIICGQILAGNQLLIKNSSNTFSLDAESATLINAIFSVIGNNGKNKIILDPTNGFKIQKLVGSTWTDVVYLDSEGNAIFSGDITGSTISGSTFNAGDGNLVIDIDGNITSIGDVSFGNGKLTFDKVTGDLILEGDITANDIFLYIDGVKTSIIDELTGKIDGQYITGGMSGTTALGNLLVDNLSTSDKIRNYLASDTSQVNYIRIYDQYIEFVEATYAGGTTQARTGDKTGDLLYWTDDTYNFVTTVDDGTLESVMVYNYTELIKGRYGFKLIDGTNIPSIELGAGSGGVNDAGKTFIYKGTDGFYIDYRNSVTGASTIFKITDSGIDLSQFTNVNYNENTTVSGMIQIWVQSDEPILAKEKDLWVDTDDFTRYDKSDISTNTTLLESNNELIKASGTITITLHPATTAGIVKYIRNVGSGIITIVGNINGCTNMILYPRQGVSLITEGDGWGTY